jgi:phytoene desaturase
MPKQLIVIGGGLGGIASALRAKKKGFEVELICQRSHLGGRAQPYHQDGYTFDAGPTVITAPHLFAELFDLFGKSIKDYVKIVPIDPWYRFVFDDHRVFDYGADLSTLLEQIRCFNPDDVNGYLALLKDSERIYQIGYEELVDQPFHRLRDMLTCIPDMLRLKSYRSVWSWVSAHLTDPALRQAFSIQPLLVGGNPFDTTSIYGLIHYLERKWGVHYAIGGTTALVQALQRLMEEEDIKITLNTKVEKIVSQHGKCTHLILSDGTIKKVDVVVSNVDPSYMYENMIDPSAINPYLQFKKQRSKSSMGLYVLYFGTNKKYDLVEHHTILMGKNYKHTLDEIFKYKTIPADLSLYLHRPSATDSSIAPAGKDAFYCLCPVPNLDGNIDWTTQSTILEQRIIQKLENYLLPELSQHIDVKFNKTPLDFRKEHNAYLGSGFTISPTLLQSAWFRYHNKAEGFQNLFLAGAGTHPGAGLPGVVSSAKVVEKLLDTV